jgi:O-antigen/teichoic acid export membrane protein
VITFVAFIFLFYLLSVPNSILLAFLISYVAPVLFIILKDSGNTPGMLRRQERHGFINQSSGKFKIFLSYGIPLTFWFVASSLIGVFSRYVMDYHLPISDVGYYSAVYDMTSKGCQLVFTPFLAAVYPLISKLYNEGQRMKSYNVIRNLVLIELAIAVPLGLGLYYLTGFYLESIIGVSVYSFSRRLVMIIFAGSFLWQLAMLLHKPLELRLRTRQMLLSVIISLVMNIVLAVIFIPKFGMIAGGYATLAGVIVYILLTLLMVTINRRTGMFSDDSRPDRTF